MRRLPRKGRCRTACRTSTTCWLIMMENHGYSQIIGDSSAPYANAMAQYQNAAGAVNGS